MVETPQYPMRIRVVDNVEPYPAPHLNVGDEYVATGEKNNLYFLPDKGGYLKSRFKPVVRVKMGRAVT